MATEALPTTNGSHSGFATADNASVTSAASGSGPANDAQSASNTSAVKPDALEIGWYFVEQYYTTLSKNPERVHLFYSKKSQSITGKEAEKVHACVGQKAISEKIRDLRLQDCKVRVLNVDSQASFQNIVVQVIGEISNNSNPHEKFVQTFVLAEQPNGYFVLNDIFRYLDLGEEESLDSTYSGKEDVAEQVPDTFVMPAPNVTAERSHDIVNDAAGVEQLDAKLEEAANQEATGDSDATADEPEVAQALPDPIEASSEIVDPAEDQQDIIPERPAEPEPSRVPSPPKEVPAPAAEAAPVKKTWANMVGSKAAGPLAVPIQSGQQAAAPKSTGAPTSIAPATPLDSGQKTDSKVQGNGWQTADHSKKQNRAQQKSDSGVLAYVKGVTEKVDARLLRITLEGFGELKHYDVSRPKNCAFVEFATADGYGAAVAANPHVINGENVLVEERRPRAMPFGGAGITVPARGTNNVNRGRGAPQGRPASQSGFSKEAGRAGFHGRGNTKGGATPRGRGQPSAA